MVDSTTPLMKDMAPPIHKLGLASSAPITSLAVLRILVGSACLLVPQRAAKFFDASINPDAIIITRLFGSRDLVFGGLLLAAYRASQSATATPACMTQLKNALYLGLIADALDVGSSVFGVLDGTLQGPGIAWVGGGASFFCALAALGLRGVGNA